MISEKQDLTVKNHIHLLWQKLTTELVDIYDAHGVCAIVANEVAEFAGCTAVVGLSGPQERYYDVWVCQPNGEMEQTRWDASKASFASFFKADGHTYQEKYSLNAPSLLNSQLWLLPREGILGSPLHIGNPVHKDNPRGILCVVDPVEGCPLHHDNIDQISLLVGTFLDRAQLRQHVHRQDVEFAVVSDISHALTSTLSLHNIFNQLMDPVRRTLNVESLSVGLIDPTSGDIEFIDILMGPLFKDMPPIRLQKGQGIAGWVADNKKPLIINDVYSDQRFYSQIDHKSGFQTNSMICIPLLVEERVIGVLQAINKQYSDFNENDLRLLQAIGGPLAAAIANARLHGDVIAEKRRIEAIFANMSEGILTINADGHISHANDALLSLVHHQDEGMVGKHISGVMKLSRSSLTEFVADVAVAEKEYPQLATNVILPGIDDVPVLMSGAAIYDEKDNVSETVLVFSDLRQIRELERMRDDFFHGVIHELRTPLATILMYARLLREGKTVGDKAKEDRFLGVIERESDRLQKMVRQMLQVVKIGAREFQRSPEPISLNEVFAEMLPPLADRATEKGLTFIQKIESDLPSVLGTYDSCYLIFKNLIDNAIKFTLSGSVRIQAQANGRYLTITIKDEGIGIPVQSIPNLFGRFFRAQTAVERGIAGTGLGLYMVKEAVSSMNGRISVESQTNEGSIFTVELPIAEI